MPTVTIIIAARPGQAEIKAVSAAKRLDYPADKLDILVARGKQPSVQRNTAVRAARGELIYFLDDDSVPEPANLRKAISLFADSAVKMAGGPNLCPSDAPSLEKVFAVVLASWLAFGPSRARYARVGTARPSGEKELILCNLIVRRDAMLELGGFNEALYPNEENALMDELQKRGGKLIYDPELSVYRRPRHSLGAFAKMLRTYGRGRAEQFRVNPTFGSAPNFVPPLFCVYLAGLLAFAVWPVGESLARFKCWAAAPLGVYGLAIVLQTLASFPVHGFLRSLLAMPLLVASHIFYGLGFWRGLFTKLNTGKDENRPRIEVVLETVTKEQGKSL
ncbi:MAG TPA: glycosyltransferase [Candidatus Paceibacterota bacterium]|nr:glycosyltransferase [Candidatus Paceibacterota bacterium]